MHVQSHDPHTTSPQKLNEDLSHSSSSVHERGSAHHRVASLHRVKTGHDSIGDQSASIEGNLRRKTKKIGCRRLKVLSESPVAEHAENPFQIRTLLVTANLAEMTTVTGEEQVGDYAITMTKMGHLTTHFSNHSRRLMAQNMG